MCCWCMLPLYFNASQILITKLHRVLMTSAHVAIGNYCCRKSTQQILLKVNWLPIFKMIQHSSISIIHNIIVNKTPKSLYLMFNTDNRRIGKEIKPRYIPKTTQYSNFYTIQGINIYNKIPNNFKLK